MRVKLDAHLPAAVGRLFSEAGHDVDTVADEGLAGAPDDQVSAEAHRAGRIVITLDRNFAGPSIEPTHPGVVILRPNGDGVLAVTQMARELLRRRTEADLKACVTIISPTFTRVRRPSQ